MQQIARVLLMGVSLFFYGIPYALAKVALAVVFAGYWIAASVRLGWTDGFVGPEGRRE